MSRIGNVIRTGVFGLLATLVFFLSEDGQSTARPANRLINETSPYLLQHAHNPVDWYPWGKEALQRARREEKLILVSIGYAACHWCHVMERESYEDEATAALLNAHFIAIKVDREERPDLDGHFMAILTAMTGSGGWPLNMFLTPDLKPVFGGTYFPVQAAFGRPSFKEVITAIHEQWRDERPEMVKNLKKLQSWLDKRLAPAPGKGDDDGEDPRAAAARFWSGRFDPQHGGIGRGTKFPQPSILSLLLRRSAALAQPGVAKPALLTLDRMAVGGVRDQLGGAFHRYSIDRRWQVPHFEIMLYDNALLARVYLEAFQLTGRSRYALVVRELLDDLLVRFRLPGGCFISSLDADSEGKEGVYYTWTEAEVKEILGAKGAGPFLETFLDPFEGLVDERSVLRLLTGPETLVKTRQNLAPQRKRLLAARSKRPPPARDDKILTSWNGLAISGLAHAGRILSEPRYREAARTCLEDLYRHSFREGEPRHSRRGDKVGGVVFVDDYAFLAQGLLDLFEADHDLAHLERAVKLVGRMLDRFQPASGQPLQLTPLDQPADVPVRVVLEDGVTPAGNSAALVALRRLVLLTRDARFALESEKITQGLAARLGGMVSASPELLWAWDFGPELAREVIIAGPPDHPATRALLREVNDRLLPGIVLVVVDPAKMAAAQKWPPLAGRTMLENRPTAYVCRNMVCRLPVWTPEALVTLLREEKRVPVVE